MLMIIVIRPCGGVSPFRRPPLCHQAFVPSSSAHGYHPSPRLNISCAFAAVSTRLLRMPIRKLARSRTVPHQPPHAVADVICGQAYPVPPDWPGLYVSVLKNGASCTSVIPIGAKTLFCTYGTYCV